MYISWLALQAQITVCVQTVKLRFSSLVSTILHRVLQNSQPPPLLVSPRCRCMSAARCASWQDAPLQRPGNISYSSIAGGINHNSSSRSKNQDALPRGSTQRTSQKHRGNNPALPQDHEQEHRTTLLEGGGLMAGRGSPGEDDRPDIGLDLTSRYHIAIPLSYFCIGFLGRYDVHMRYEMHAFSPRKREHGLRTVYGGV